MYAFVDQPVAELNRGGQFLVWSMRSWVQSLDSKDCAAMALAPTFSKFGMIAALPQFQAAMRLFQRDGLEPLRFSPVRCGFVNEDEALLLSLFATLRSGDSARMRATLEMLVTEDAVGPLLAACATITARLIEAELIPEATTAQPVAK